MDWILQEFPKDLNGDVLRRMQSVGDDLSKPREIDFEHIFEKKEDAELFAESVRNAGYQKVIVRFSTELSKWDVQVKIFMIPMYDEITKTELTLHELAQKNHGRADGWGCFKID
jgi:hypothetical protein